MVSMQKAKMGIASYIESSEHWMNKGRWLVVDVGDL